MFIEYNTDMIKYIPTINEIQMTKQFCMCKEEGTKRDLPYCGQYVNCLKYLWISNSSNI